jgi:RNA polymerase sigma-70 factor (ECF subfamily)
MRTGAVETEGVAQLADGALIALARGGNEMAFRHIMQTHNQRLYRVARSVLGDDAEAEDAVQEAYLRAFMHLDGFRGEARLSTWLTRIVLNEALGRLRQRRTAVELGAVDAVDDTGEARVIYLPSARRESDPESAAARAEVRRLLERAVDRLPPAFRTVFVMREIEEMSVEETAAHLGLKPETVKTRLHRARRLLREALKESLSGALADTFSFQGDRCARITARVLDQLRADRPEREGP